MCDFVSGLELSVKASNLLRFKGIVTAEQFAALTKDEFLKGIHGGVRAWREIEEVQRNIADELEPPRIGDRPLSHSRVRELLDYAEVYGEFDENTPNGTVSTLCSEPMNDERRGAIKALKVVLGLLPEMGDD